MKKDVPRHTSQPSKAEHSSESLLIKGERWFSGPIPPPEIGAGWKDVLPDVPDRIFKMAEKEQQHRHDTERLGLELQYKLKNRGQLMAFLIGLIGLGGGIGLLMIGSNLAGGSAFLISLTALVGTYYYNTIPSGKLMLRESKESWLPSNWKSNPSKWGKALKPTNNWRFALPASCQAIAIITVVDDGKAVHRAAA